LVLVTKSCCGMEQAKVVLWWAVCKIKLSTP